MQTLVSRVGEAVRNPSSGRRAFYEHYAIFINLGALLALCAIYVFWQWITVIVPAGHVGAKWYRFMGGTDTDTIYEEGIHFVWPWDSIAVYDARLQLISRDFDVLTKDGLTMSVTVSCQFRINIEAVGKLHKNVGATYIETVLIPTLASHARAILSQNSTDDVFSARRIMIQHEIGDAVLRELGKQLGYGTSPKDNPWFFINNVLVSSMQFPAEVQSAINRKMEQYQLRQEYAYRLEREELESRRKEVEARGIAQFQSIVGTGISDTYLRWKGIDATLALARSANAKIVVIGTNRDGMPLILGGVDAPLSPVLGQNAGANAGSDQASPQIREQQSKPQESLPPDLGSLPSSATRGE